MLDSSAEFSNEEQQLLETAMREQADHDAAMLKEAEEEARANEALGQSTATAAAPAQATAQAAAAPAAAPAAAEGSTSAAPAPQAAAHAPAAAVPAAQAPAAAPATSRPEGGDARAALRAARREERKLRAELEKARIELDGFRKQAQPQDAKSKRPSDDVMRDVEAYAAPAAEYIAELERTTAELAAKVQTTAGTKTGEPVFTPEFIPDADLQEVVDSIDELSDWQNNAQYAKHWTAAKKMDDLLAVMPAWAGKPDKERLEEVVRRVKQEFTGAQAPAPKAPATADDAKRVIDAIPAANAPVTIGDMRGGSAPSHSTIPDFRQMVRDGATDEEIMASLK